MASIIFLQEQKSGISPKVCIFILYKELRSDSSEHQKRKYYKRNECEMDVLTLLSNQFRWLKIFYLDVNQKLNPS